MGVGKITYTKATLTVDFTPGSTTFNSRNFQSRYEWMPDKVNGAFITLPGGTRFRKATARQKWTYWIEGGSAQHTESRFNTSTVVIDSSPGGYTADTLMTANGPPIQSGIGGVAKFNSPPQIPKELRNESVTKSLLDIADQKVALGEDLATFRQTQSMIAVPASALVGGLRKMARDKDMRKHLTRSYHDLLKHGVTRKIADKYLEYIYGFKPLMEDIYGIIAIMKEKGAKSLLLSGEGTSSATCEIVCGDINISNAKTEIVSGQHNAKCHTKIWSRIDPDHGGLRLLNSLGLINPLSLTWELIPWTFVTDWFLPIGSVLQALTAPAGLIFVNGSTSVRHSLNANYVHHYTYYDSRAKVNNFAGGSIFYEGYKREVHSSWPLPGLWASSSPFRGDRPFKALALAISNLPRELRF